jgi:hypothetical protein
MERLTIAESAVARVPQELEVFPIRLQLIASLLLELQGHTAPEQASSVRPPPPHPHSSLYAMRDQAEREGDCNRREVVLLCHQGMFNLHSPVKTIQGGDELHLAHVCW